MTEIYSKVELRVNQAFNALCNEKQPNIAAAACTFDVPEQRLQNQWRGA